MEKEKDVAQCGASEHHRMSFASCPATPCPCLAHDQPSCTAEKQPTQTACKESSNAGEYNVPSYLCCAKYCQQIPPPYIYIYTLHIHIVVYVS